MTKQFDPQAIEDKLDKVTAGAVVVSDQVGGVIFKDMAQVMEFSKLLSLSGTAIPKHLRNNPGGCLAVTIQALEWRMSPIAVANQSYEVSDKIAYMSQLIHAVVEARAPLKQRLRASYEGEGEDRICIITGHFKGEIDPVEYRSPKFGKITPKNSPLWKSDPDQQQFYYSVRAFARRFCPDVLLGIYSEDELPGDQARDVTPDKPDIASRLNKKAEPGAGFSESNVKALEHNPGQTLEMASTGTKEAVPVGVVSDTVVDEHHQGTMELSSDDPATEIEAKKRAIKAADTKDDIEHLVSAARKYLRGKKRQDLLNDLLTAQRDRLKQLGIEE